MSADDSFKTPGSWVTAVFLMKTLLIFWLLIRYWCSTLKCPDSVEATHSGSQDAHPTLEITLPITFNGTRFQLRIVTRSRTNLSWRSGLFGTAELCFVFKYESTFWNDGWELGAILRGVGGGKTSLPWWAVDDGERVAVIRVVRDPSCPGALSPASWMHRDTGSHQDHRDTSQMRV